MSFHNSGVEHILAHFGPSSVVAAVTANAALVVEASTNVPTYSATDAGVFLSYGGLKFGPYRTLRAARLSHVGALGVKYAGGSIMAMHRRLEAGQSKVLAEMRSAYPEVFDEAGLGDELRWLRKEEKAALGIEYNGPVLVTGAIAGEFLITLYTPEHPLSGEAGADRPVCAAAAIQSLNHMGSVTVIMRRVDLLVQVLAQRGQDAAKDLISAYRGRHAEAKELFDVFQPKTVKAAPGRRKTGKA